MDPGPVPDPDPQHWYNEFGRIGTVRITVLLFGFVDYRRFDADPDPTFHFDANLDPTPSSTHLRLIMSDILFGIFKCSGKGIVYFTFG